MSLQRIWSRGAIYFVLIAFCLFFLMPFYVMFITGLKPYEDVNVTRMWELPTAITWMALLRRGIGWRQTLKTAWWSRSRPR